jgi:hypothetical protein
MKKFFTLLFIGLGLSSMAQFSFSGQEATYTGTLAALGASGELSSHWSVTNTTNSTITVRVNRSTVSSVAGSQNRFCWNGICFSPSTNTSTMPTDMTLAAGASTTSANGFMGYYTPNNNAGQTTVEYCFFSVADPNVQSCLTVNYCVDCEIGVAEVQQAASLGELSTNPLRGVGSLAYNLGGQASNGKIIIYTITGQQVKTINLGSRDGVIFLDGSEFEPGMYFYSLQSNGKVIGTHKMIVTR